MAVEFIGESVAYKTRRFDVVEARMRIRGRTITKPFIRHNDIVFVIPITNSGEIVLIRSYRPELRRYVLELPSGTLKTRESPERGAVRELLEETGFVAGKMSHIISGYPMLGYSDAKYHFFKATRLKRGEQRLENDEDIEVAEVSQKYLLRLIASNKLDDINIALALQHLDKK